MENYAINVINSVQKNPDNLAYYNNLLSSRRDPNLFHSHVNNFLSLFKGDISNKTLSLINEYNTKYTEWAKKQTLQQMANEYDVDQIQSLLDNSLNVTYNLDHLSDKLKLNSIKKRGPSKKKKPNKTG
jgi:hypothetical protein